MWSIEATSCPYCHCPLGVGSVVITEEQPEPGDFVVCRRCRQVLVFDSSMVLSIPGTEDLERIICHNPCIEIVREALARNTPPSAN
jgi:hypothetical protein